MTILSSELLLKKSKTIDETANNGGLMDNASSVLTGVVNNVWPSVFKSERLAGSTKYRKLFLKVENDNDETFYNPQFWLDIVTPGDDWVIFFPGTQTDTQGDIAGTENCYGCALLKNNVTAGAGSIVVTVEDAVLATGAADEIFRDGDTIRITNKDTPTSGTGTEEAHVISGAPTVVGNDITLPLAGTLSNDYNTNDNALGTRVMSVYEPGDVVAAYNSLVATTPGDGAYDDTACPIVIDNIGTINQTVTITFTDATNFTVASNIAGVTLEDGVITSDYGPINPETSKPYFTIEKEGWTGTWANGDTLVFETVPAAVPIWQKRVIPAGAASLTGNKTTIVFSGESA
jgi:hypothetical protein